MPNQKKKVTFKCSCGHELFYFQTGERIVGQYRNDGPPPVGQLACEKCATVHQVPL